MMNAQVDNFQELRTLSALIRHAGPDGEVDWNNPKLATALSTTVTNSNILEDYLFNLNKAGVIYFEMVGEDGFEPIVIARIKDRTHEHLAEVLDGAEKYTQSLRLRLTEILTFNPELLSGEIDRAGKDLEQVQSNIAGNEMLQPMRKQVTEIQRHFESVKAVSKQYENIYKNILRPVQREGAAGVKATVKWAIIGIVASAAVSITASIWPLITSRPKGGDAGYPITNRISSASQGEYVTNSTVK